LFDLYSQTKQAHWNVKGEEFYQLHELFDEIAEELVKFMDMVAERATALGGEALGTVRMAAAAPK
jgi:starvation-inducible DNA-binding protein